MSISEVLAQHALTFPGDPNHIDQLSDVLPLAVRQARSKWLAERSQLHACPQDAPIICSLVEAEMKNLPYLGSERNDFDSVGPYQQRDAYGTRAQRNNWIWGTDAFLRELWRVRSGNLVTGDDGVGEWVADAQRPAIQYRNRYQQRLWEARDLRGGEQVIVVTEGRFTAKNPSTTQVVNKRSIPTTAGTHLGEIPVSGSVQCDGYTLQGLLFGGTTTWLRLANNAGWVTKALMTATLPPTNAQLAEKVRTLTLQVQTLTDDNARLAGLNTSLSEQNVGYVLSLVQLRGQLQILTDDLAAINIAEETAVSQARAAEQKYTDLVARLQTIKAQSPGVVYTLAQLAGVAA